jgi:hypothetical protein
LIVDTGGGTNATSIQSYPISDTNPNNYDILTYNSLHWAPTNDIAIDDATVSESINSTGSIYITGGIVSDLFQSDTEKLVH